MDKLSKLQKFILFCLLTKEGSTMPRRKFSELVYRNYFRTETTTPAMRAALSKSYRRLEERGLIMRIAGCWRLTPSNLENGQHEFGGDIIAELEFAERNEKPKRRRDYS